MAGYRRRDRSDSADADARADQLEEGIPADDGDLLTGTPASDTAVLDGDLPGRDPVEEDLLGTLPGEDAVVTKTVTKTRRGAGWGRVFRSNRSLWIIALIAIASLIGGLLLGRFVLSPADAASLTDPPEAGLITVPIELGPLSNDVTIRGEVGYADSVEVTIDAASLDGAVVTGGVPEVGATLEALSIALEVVGRPVVVLPGDLPAYRTLSLGMTGPDVVQFKTAMRAVGLDAGDPASNVFDVTAAVSVSSLYEKIGYPAPASAEGSIEAVQGAKDGVTAAQESLDAARADLDRASAGPSAVDIKIKDNAVASAQRALDDAKRNPESGMSVGDAQDALSLAQLERDALNAAADTSAEQAAVARAEEGLVAANTALARAQEQALPALPAGEVLYLGALPRRVDAVNAVRGQVLQGAAMTVSGATITLTGSIAPADATLLTLEDAAVFELPDGGEHEAVITALTPGKDAAERWTVTMEPAPLTPEQTQQLQGTNVRVSIAVGATAGDVLFVPLAAITAGPGGESRVEVVDGDPKQGEEAETRLVIVETGLAAAGAVEITAVEGDLAEGDLVVVGR